MGTYDLGWARLGWADSGQVGDNGGRGILERLLGGWAGFFV